MAAVNQSAILTNLDNIYNVLKNNQALSLEIQTLGAQVIVYAADGINETLALNSLISKTIKIAEEAFAQAEDKQGEAARIERTYKQLKVTIDAFGDCECPNLLARIMHALRTFFNNLLFNPVKKVDDSLAKIKAKL
jgi:hypothetical protein